MAEVGSGKVENFYFLGTHAKEHIRCGDFVGDSKLLKGGSDFGRSTFGKRSFEISSNKIYTGGLWKRGITMNSFVLFIIGASYEPDKIGRESSGKRKVTESDAESVQWAFERG